jgi:hypothetical protein
MGTMGLKMSKIPTDFASVLKIAIVIILNHLIPDHIKLLKVCWKFLKDFHENFSFQSINCTEISRIHLNRTFIP